MSLHQSENTGKDKKEVRKEIMEKKERKKGHGREEASPQDRPE